MRIRITYDTVTPESAEHGDSADSGWIDEDGIEISEDDIAYKMDFDEIEREEAIVALAIDIIGTCVEASSYPFWHDGTWYTDCDVSYDRAYFEEGSETRQSYHLDGFDDDIARAIYAELTNR